MSEADAKWVCKTPDRCALAQTCVGGCGLYNWTGASVASSPVNAMEGRGLPIDPMKAAVTRAVLLCKDRRFQQWIGYTRDMGPGGLAEANTTAWLRKHCEIESRAEIATNPDAHERFLKLETSYRHATGQMAEVFRRCPRPHPRGAGR